MSGRELRREAGSGTIEARYCFIIREGPPMRLEKVRRILKKEGFSRDQFEDGLYQFYLFGPYVAPLEVGFFFKNLKRFSKPVTFNWPPGPVKPIYTKITTGSELQAERKRLGFYFINA